MELRSLNSQSSKVLLAYTEPRFPVDYKQFLEMWLSCNPSMKLPLLQKKCLLSISVDIQTDQHKSVLLGRLYKKSFQTLSRYQANKVSSDLQFLLDNSTHLDK